MASKIEISHRTIVFTVVLLAGIWLIIQIRDILFLLFISFILMSALRPLVDALSRYKLPRVIAILIVYGLIFGVFGLSVASMIPSLASQSTRLATQLPVFVGQVLPYWDIDVRSLTQQITPIGENLLKLTLGIFSNIITTLAVLVFSFYLILERNNTESFLRSFMGDEAAQKILTVLRTIEGRLSAWVRGQIFLMVFIGLLVYLGLTLLHIEFALPLAILAGILEIVPTIGPIVSAIPAVLVALAISPVLALSVIALYFIIQQLENNLVVPLVMKRSVGLSPLVTIITVMIGARLAGVVGAILSIPTFLVIQTLISSTLFEASEGTKKK